MPHHTTPRHGMPRHTTPHLQEVLEIVLDNPEALDSINVTAALQRIAKVGAGGCWRVLAGGGGWWRVVAGLVGAGASEPCKRGRLGGVDAAPTKPALHCCIPVQLVVCDERVGARSVGVNRGLRPREALSSDAFQTLIGGWATAQQGGSAAARQRRSGSGARISLACWPVEAFDLADVETPSSAPLVSRCPLPPAAPCMQA